MKDRKLREALGYRSQAGIKTDVQASIEMLRYKINALQAQLQNQPIGEVYKQKDIYGISMATEVVSFWWQEFSQKDIDDQVDDKIKIRNIWHSKDDVVFYSDISKQKRKVEKKYEKRK